MEPCPICRKLSGEVAVDGCFLCEDELVAAFPAASVEGPEGPAYLGRRGGPEEIAAFVEQLRS